MMACGAVLNIRGEHFDCEEDEGHLFSHSNKEAQAIWCSEDERKQMARVLTEMSKLGL